MSIFSTYSAGENRVTASIQAVLQSLSLGRIERLIGALLEQSEFSLVNFQNQVSKGAPGVPDAEISSSCRILIETKIKQGKAGEDQLRRHLKRLDRASEKELRLLVLTPDQVQPPVIDRINDDRIVWA